MAKKVTHQYFEGVGRRKTSTARIRLYPLQKGKEIAINSAKLKVGDIYLNDKPIAVHFSHPEEKVRFTQPLELTNSREKFAVSIRVRGGGKNGQLEAVIHGLSRALVKVDEENNRKLLKKEGFLTRDPRGKERRKVGTGGKARRKKQSPKR